MLYSEQDDCDAVQESFLKYLSVKMDFRDAVQKLTQNGVHIGKKSVNLYNNYRFNEYKMLLNT